MKRITIDEYKKRLKSVNAKIEVIDLYINYTTAILHKCECGNDTWMVTPSNTLKGKRCMKCSGFAKFSYDYVKKFVEIESHSGCRLISDTYVDYDYKLDILCKCGCMFQKSLHDFKQQQYSCNICSLKNRGMKNECQQFFNSSWDKMYRSRACPHCSIKAKSRGELRISEYLNLNNISYEQEKSFHGLYGVNNGLLRYDFYLSDYNLLIEFNGLQHTEAIDYFGGDDKFQIQQEHDNRKQQYADKSKIQLLTIHYTNLNDIFSILEQQIK